jgi:hypothetical protein
MNNEKVCFLHIPKNGGTFIGQYLYGYEIPHEPFGKKYGRIDDLNKYYIIFSIIREPIGFYISLFRFLRNSTNIMANLMQPLAQQYNDINDFIYRVMDGDTLIPNIHVSGAYDNYSSDYGILTHYLHWFCEPFIPNISNDPAIFIEQIYNSKIIFLNFNNLNNEINKFIKTYNLTIFNNSDYNYNKSEPNISNVNYELNDTTIDFIKEKDKYIYQYFFPN